MAEPSLTRLIASATIDPSPERRRVEVGVELWAQMSDGRRFLALAHGFGMALMGAGAADAPFPVPPVTEEDVRNVLIPDDDDDPEPLPWAFLVEQLAEGGLTTTVDELRALPYEVEFFAGDAGFGDFDD